MDDGYWESLLRDVENSAPAPKPISEEEIVPGPALAESYHEWRPRSSGSDAADDESDWARAEALLASGETLMLGGGRTATVTVASNSSEIITSVGAIENVTRRVQADIRYNQGILTITSWKEIP